MFTFMPILIVSSCMKFDCSPQRKADHEATKCAAGPWVAFAAGLPSSCLLDDCSNLHWIIVDMRISNCTVHSRSQLRECDTEQISL